MPKFNDIEQKLNTLDLSLFSKSELARLKDLLNGKIEEIDTESNKHKVMLPEEDRKLHKLCQENRSSSNACPHCGSIAVIKNGTKDGRQRYLCKDCKRTYGETYGTAFYHSKLSAENWELLLTHIFQKETVRWIHKETSFNFRTILYNRHRVAEVIKKLIENRDDFRSVAECDEIFFGLDFKDIKSPKFFMQGIKRMPYTSMNKKQTEEYVTIAEVAFDTLLKFKVEHEEEKEYLQEYMSSADTQSSTKISKALTEMDSATKQKVLQILEGKQKRKRGISNQQVCVSSCIDHSGNKYIQPVCLGRIEPRHLENSVCKHFTDSTILVTDGLRAYRTVTSKLGISLRQIPSGKHSSGKFNLALINGYHSSIRSFMSHFGDSVASKYIDNYMGLFYWLQDHKDDKVEDMVSAFMGIMARQSQKTKLHEFKYSELPFDTKTLKTVHKDYWDTVKKHDKIMNAKRTARRNERLLQKRIEKDLQKNAQGQSI